MPSRILRLWNPDAGGPGVGAWEEVGDSRLTAHLAAADPHGGYVLETLADAKGDLLAASAADTVGRLALGTDGQVLTADSTQALGVRWAPGGGGGLPTTGGTMTGTIAVNGAAADAGGALAVTSPAGAVADARVYGAGTGAYAPATSTAASREYGATFTPAAAQYLVAVRWYRSQVTAGVTPLSVRLWDTTSTATPVWSVSTPAEWNDTAAGWKEHRLAAGTPPLLVAGRSYVVSYTAGGSTFNARASYTPVPDAGIAFVTHVTNTTAGGYPTTTGTTAFGIDAALRPTTSAPSPAASGALRLPNALPGAVVWRNANDSGDLALTVDASNQLTFNGAPLASGSFLPLAGGTLSGDLVVSEATPTVSLKQAADTQPRSRLTDTALAFGPGGSTAPDATLSRTGAGALRVDNNLGVGVAPQTAWHINRSAIHLDTGGASVAGAEGGAGLYLRDNGYLNASAQEIATTTDPSTRLFLEGSSGIYCETAPAVAAGAVQTWTRRLTLAQTGTLTLTPDAGANGLVVTLPGRSFAIAGWAGDGTSSQLNAAGHLALNPSSQYVVPPTDNTHNLGAPPSLRWNTIFATNGTIQTSSREAKEGITPLDPAAALEAVRSTPAVTFTYKAPERPPEYYDLPDDPVEAQAVLEQRARAAPLEEAARTQAGFIAEDAAPLFLTGEGQTNPSNTAGVLLAALQAIDARLTQLEGAA